MGLRSVGLESWVLGQAARARKGDVALVMVTVTKVTEGTVSVGVHVWVGGVRDQWV